MLCRSAFVTQMPRLSVGFALCLLLCRMAGTAAAIAATVCRPPPVPSVGEGADAVVVLFRIGSPPGSIVVRVDQFVVVVVCLTV